MLEPVLKYCGHCGSASLKFDGLKQFTCETCAWIFFINPAAAVSGAITIEGKLLLARRAVDPGKGLLDLPGGFIDPDEKAEEALTRELREELGITVTDFSYVGTWPNRYSYAGVLYHTLDLIFSSTLASLPVDPDREEIAGLELHAFDKIDFDEVAFRSVRNALQELRRGRKAR